MMAKTLLPKPRTRKLSATRSCLSGVAFWITGKDRGWGRLRAVRHTGRTLRHPARLARDVPDSAGALGKDRLDRMLREPGTGGHPLAADAGDDADSLVDLRGIHRVGGMRQTIAVP